MLKEEQLVLLKALIASNIELFAEIEHNSWSRWMEYLFSKGEFLPDGSWVMPKTLVDHWTRQVNTDYDSLTEREKESDRKEVYKMLQKLERYMRE